MSGEILLLLTILSLVTYIILLTIHLCIQLFAKGSWNGLVFRYHEMQFIIVHIDERNRQFTDHFPSNSLTSVNDLIFNILLLSI